MIKNYLILGCLLLCSNYLFGQFKPVQDGTLDVGEHSWFTKDVGEVYTPSVVSYDELNSTWKIYGSGIDFSRNANDDIGPTVLTKIPNGDWEMIVRVLSPDYIYATGYAFKEINLDDGTGTGTKKTYYPGEVLAPQPRFSSNGKYGIVFRENLNKRCREAVIGTGRRIARVNVRKDYEEDEEGNIVTDARYQYSGGYRPSGTEKDPTWLRVVKRGASWSFYYALTSDDVSYDSADDVEWTKHRDFEMALDSANIYAGIFFASGWNHVGRGSSYEVRDPRATQTYDNLILRAAPPLWQLATPMSDISMKENDWYEKDITNMFDHDLDDELNYRVESSDENVAFAYIEDGKATNGSDTRKLRIKGISSGVVKMKVWWDVGGYHLEDVFYVNVEKGSVLDNVTFSDTLMNHIMIGSSASEVYTGDDQNGQIRILCNATGNNTSFTGKNLTAGGIYYPMEWDGTPDSVEVVYESVNDSRFFHTGGVMFAGDLSATSAAAGIAEGTTVSGGKGYQTTYHYHRNSGETVLTGGPDPAFKGDGTLTSPNKVLYRTHFKVVRRDETTFDVFSRRDDTDIWKMYTKTITDIDDAYIILYNSQTRSGSPASTGGSYFSNLKINGKSIHIEDQNMEFSAGETKHISFNGHFGQKLGETWSDYSISVSNDSRFTVSMDADGFVINEVYGVNTTEVTPIVISAKRNGEFVSHTLYAQLSLTIANEYVALSDLLANPEISPSIVEGDSQGSFSYNSYQNNLTNSTSDVSTYLYEEVAMSDSSDVTVYISDLNNAGEKSRAGLMIREAGEDGDEAYVALFATAEEGLKFQYRWKQGLSATEESVELEDGVELNLEAPIYFKLRKVGKWFFPYVSNDGLVWHIARKYAFPLDFDADSYYTGFTVATTDNFKIPVVCNTQEFAVTVGANMEFLNNTLPMFKSIGDDNNIEDEIQKPSASYAKVFQSEGENITLELQTLIEGQVSSAVYNTTGGIARRFNNVYVPSSLSRVTFNVSGLTPGVYIFKAKTPNGDVSEKIILR